MTPVSKSKVRKPKKTVRKGNKNGVRKAKSKSARKVARKASAKSARRPVRKAAAKSTRRPARKAAAKTRRLTTRKQTSKVGRRAAPKTKKVQGKRGKRLARLTGSARTRSQINKPKVRKSASAPTPGASSVASLAASVLSRRALAAPTRARETSSSKATPPAASAREPRIRRKQTVRHGRSGSGARRTNRELVRVNRMPQYAYMKAPGASGGFDVGDPVEVLCDHEKDSERVRGWIKGVVVQVDNKLVAVQFRTNVFLTDGWMVPDRILWYAVASDQIRSLAAGKKSAQKPLPEY